MQHEKIPKTDKSRKPAVTTPSQLPRSINGMILLQKNHYYNITHTHTQLISESTKKIIRCSYIWRMSPKFLTMGRDCFYYVIQFINGRVLAHKDKAMIRSLLCEIKKIICTGSSI